MGNGDSDTPITQVYMPPRAAVLRLVDAGVVRGLDAVRLGTRLRAEVLGRRRGADGRGGRARHPHFVLRNCRQRACATAFVARRSLPGWRRPTSSPRWRACCTTIARSIGRSPWSRRSRRRASFREPVQSHRARARRRRAQDHRGAHARRGGRLLQRGAARAPGGSGASSRSTPRTAGRCTWRSSCGWRASSSPRGCAADRVLGLSLRD